MIAEIVDDMVGGGRADMAGAVGAGCGQRPGAGGKQRLRHRVRRYAHGQRGEAGRDQVGDAGIRRQRQDQGQRPRPEGVRQPLGILAETDVVHGFGGRADMDDQRVEARPPLGEENAPDGGRIGSIGGKPVDRLGRHRHQFATLERRDGGVKAGLA